MQITDLAKEQQIPAWWRLAFRPLFAGAASFACLSIALWGLFLAGVLPLPLQVDPLFWHSHEMLFGMVSAAVGGFLLTAAQNWSGLRGLHGRELQLLFCCWLLGRIGFFLPIPAHAQALLDLLYLPALALSLALPIWRARLYRNLFFVPVLLLLTLCNALMWFGQLHAKPLLQQHAIHSALMLICMLMLIIGGRVLPGFTANGLKQPVRPALPWLNNLALGLAWLVTLLELSMQQALLPWQVPASLALLAGLCNGWRWLRLAPWRTVRVPLLWSLHLAYGCVCLGFVLLALQQSGLLPVSRSLVLHVFTVAGMGLMILSMMSRVSLGHSGRALQPPAALRIAFVLLGIAALSRVLFAAMFPAWYSGAVFVAASCWVLGFAIFVVCYWSILSQPRVDGRPG